jgi:hypothetical protein
MKEDMEVELGRATKFIETMSTTVHDEIFKALRSEEFRYGAGGGGTQDILQTEGGAQVRKALLMKADKMDIEKMYEMKSNKGDTEIMLDCQEMICKYFKQLLVLFIEVVNFQNTRPNDTKQGVENRQGNLIAQV